MGLRSTMLGLSSALLLAAPARADFLDDLRRTFQQDIPRVFQEDIPRAFGAEPQRQPKPARVQTPRREQQRQEKDNRRPPPRPAPPD